ncbi:MAG: tRNA lysidine(34) synthetase TilS [Solirubrobacteraceae bacterium]
MPIVEEVQEAVRAGGLFARERPALVMLSGGRDSTCLLDVAVELLGAGAVGALHVNYGLRAAAEGEELHCRDLCRRLGVPLDVVRAPAGAPSPPGGDGDGDRATAPGGAARSGDGDGATDDREVGGNLQAWARRFRYAEAERLARARDALIAAGHTASDQAETVLYRLAASPGRRALLGMAAAEGRLIRPLLTITREQTAAYCRARGLQWREDESNEDRRFARARVRHELMPALRAVHPAAEANVVRTAALLRGEAELLDGLVDAELGGRQEIALARLRELPAALARLVVVRLAEHAAGTYVPQAGGRVQELLALGRRGGRAELHLGGRAGAVIEQGVLRIVKLPPRPGRRCGERRPGED